MTQRHWCDITFIVIRLSAQKRCKKHKKCNSTPFLSLKVGQPDNHMPFPSIYSTYPWTNPWNFCEKICRVGGFEKLVFFWVGHFDFFFICFIPMKISHKLCVTMDGSQFFYYDGLQPKMSARMIKEHKCNFNFFLTISSNFSAVLKILTYLTRAITTCGFYTFYPLSEVHLCTVNFGLIYG